MTQCCNVNESLKCVSFHFLIKNIHFFSLLFNLTGTFISIKYTAANAPPSSLIDPPPLHLARAALYFEGSRHQRAHLKLMSHKNVDTSALISATNVHSSLTRRSTKEATI